jgi:hypothetical protein
LRAWTASKNGSDDLALRPASDRISRSPICDWPEMVTAATPKPSARAT